jgi:hypothetical protein
MSKKIGMAKAMTRTLIDFCVLPGTALGAEILWLYSVQWKNKASLVVLAIVSFIYSNMFLVINEQLSSRANGPENTL